MRRTTLLIAALLGTVVPACASETAAPAAEKRASDDGRLMPPEKLTEHVWYMRQPERLWSAVIGNVLIIEQSDGVVLVDSGGSVEDGRDVVRAVAGLTSKPVKSIVVTHWHNDHPLGIPGILERFPKARIIATAKTAELMADPEVLGVGVGKPDPKRLRTREEGSRQRSEEYRKMAANPSVPEDVRAEYRAEATWILERLRRQTENYVVVPAETFTDKLLIDDPAVPVQLLNLGRANTKGDALVWLPRQQLVATGDVVVSPTPYGFVSPIAPWLATLDQLERYSFRTLVPGHGPVQRDRSYLATLRWSMNDIRRQAIDLAKTGATPEQAQDKFDTSEHHKRFGADNAWKKRWLDGYWLAGMFDTAFNQAAGVPLEPGSDGGEE